MLDATHEGLKIKLEASEERLRSTEEKARSYEAFYVQRVSQLENQVHSCETAYAEVVLQAQEKARVDALTHGAEVSRLEERVQASELANSELAEKLDRCRVFVGPFLLLSSQG